MNNDRRCTGALLAWLGAVVAMTLSPVSQAEPATGFAHCVRHAQTQMAINDCATSSLHAANMELARVYKKIRTTYKGDPAFLDRLERAQKAWRHLRDADFAMMYPHLSESGYWGSAFPTCAARFKADLVQRRIKFLKRWLHGVQEGDLCGGSIKATWDMKSPRRGK